VRDDGAGAAARADAVCPVGAHRFFAEPAEELGGIGHLRTRVGLRLAVLDTDQRGEPIGVGDHQIESTAQHFGTDTGRCRRPVTKCAVRRRHRVGGLRGGTVGDLGNDLLGGGVIHIECRFGAQPTAVDEDTVFGVQRGDGVLCVHWSPYG
jgi:hypothetical protein